MKTKDRIIVALDVDTPEKALSLVKNLKPHVGCFKIGLQFITAMLRSIISPEAEELAIANLRSVRRLFTDLGGNILWDGKFDDIPNTVGGASQEVVKIGVKMFNVHASAGIKAMRAATVVNKSNSTRVLAVTVLTSLEENNANLIFGAPSRAKVLQLARDAKHAGCDGIICSSQELKLLCSQEELQSLLKITPGIRPKWFRKKDDQSRKMTPGEAIKAGADYLVIGRPITQPPEKIGSPADAAKKIAEEIAQALKEKGDE